MLSGLVAWLRRCGAEEEGSTLVLYPFALLIVLGLGGLAIDGAVFFQAHRGAVDTAAGLANDMAAVIDEQAFATQQVVQIDLDRAEQMLQLTNHDLAEHRDGLQCTARLGSTSAQIVVQCTGAADPILGIGVFGTFGLSGTATATASTS